MSYRAKVGDACTISVVSASYGDELNSDGIYVPDEFKIEFESAEFLRALAPVLHAHKAPMTVVVIRDREDGGEDSDLLEKCECTNLAAAIKSASKQKHVEVVWSAKRILWTNDRMALC